MAKEYIGDGAYIEFDGYSIILSTEDGLSTTNRVCLEPECVRKMLDYICTLGTGAREIIRTSLTQYYSREHVAGVQPPSVADDDSRTRPDSSEASTDERFLRVVE